MPLKPCLKAATNLNDQDVETILENFDTYKESMKPKAASIAAIDDAITSAQEERSETLDLVYKTHPGLAPTRFNESQLEKLFNIDNDTTMVSMDLVKGRESVPQDAKDRAAGFMRASIESGGAAREPLTAWRVEKKDGSFYYSIRDGNTTLRVLQDSGITQVPITVEREISEEKMKPVREHGIKSTDMLAPNNFVNGTHKERAAQIKRTNAGVVKLKAKQNGWSTDDHYSEAHENQLYLNNIGKSISKALGIKYISAPPKFSETPAGEKRRASVEKKIKDKYGGDGSKITDVVRGSFAISDPDMVPSIVKMVSKRLVGVDEGWQINNTGYFDRKVLIQMDNGQIAEIQIFATEVGIMKEEYTHPIYEAYKALQEEDPETGRMIIPKEKQWLANLQVNAMVRGIAEAVLSAENPAWAKLYLDLAESYDLTKSLSVGIGILAPNTIMRGGSSAGPQDPSLNTLTEVAPSEARSDSAYTSPSYEYAFKTLPKSTSISSDTSSTIIPRIVLRAGDIVPEGPQTAFRQPYDFAQHHQIPENKPKKPLHVSTVRALVDRLQRDNPGMGKVNFHIFDKQDEAFGPGSLEKHGVLEGGYYAGTDDILIIAEHIKDEAHLLRVVRHETVGHYGLRKILNKDGAYDKLLDRVYKARDGELKELYDWVARLYPDLVRKDDVKTIADEMLARAAETATETSLLKRIWDQIIKLLNQYGIGGKISHKEIQSLIRSSAANLKKDSREPTQSEQIQDFEQMEYDMYLEFTDDKNPMSFDQWSALAKRGPLPMGVEARKKRARQQGFNTSKVWYHGTTRRGDNRKIEKSDFDYGIPMGDLMPGTDAFKASLNRPEFEEFQMDFKDIKRDFIMATGSTMLAGSFAGTGASAETSTEGGRIIPLYARTKKTFDYENFSEAEKKSWREWTLENMGTSADLTIREQEIEQGRWAVLEGQDMQAWLRFEGYDSFYAKERGEKNLGVMNPNQFRSINATFAPFDAESARLLARRAPALEIRPAVRTVTGKIMTDDRGGPHANLIFMAQAEGDIVDGYDGLGFVDKDGKWLTRIDAMNLAKEKGLVKKDPPGGIDWKPDRLASQQLLASRGTPKVADQTETPEFKAWFGDSKVVDEGGYPLVVYHGTGKSFGVFKPRSPVSIGGEMLEEEGVSSSFFTSSKAAAYGFAEGAAVGPGTSERVMQVYLKIQNPLVIEADGKSWNKSHDEIVSAAKGKEYDGVIIKNSYDGFFEGEVQDVYITFDPKQVKSATDNFGAFDPTDPRIMFSRAAQDAQDAPTGGNLGMPDETLVDKFVRIAQDNFSRVKQLQKTIEAKGGEVSQEGDVYRAEERSSGKIADRLEKFKLDYMDPLTKIMDENDITLGELDEYGIALHARERNAWIAAINEEMPDGGSGMTNDEADAVLAKVRNGDKQEAMDQAMSIVYGVNDQNLDDLVDGGHMTQNTVNAWRDRWSNYVPLKGKEGEDTSLGTGSGYSLGKAKTIQALGRGAGNMAESPTAHSFAQAEATIVRTEKTKVGQALVQLVRDNPDPELWTITKRTYKKFVNLFGEPFEGWDEAPEGLTDRMDYHRVFGISAQESADAIAEGRKPVKKTVYMVDRHYGERDDVFKVMVEGEELLIRIQDPVLVDQLKKMSTTQLGGIVRFFGQVNRYLAMINTALNPEFVITNFERDFPTAMINLGGEHSAAIAAKVAKNIPGAIRGILQGTFDTKGKSEWRDLWAEMKSEGGSIGFFGLEDIETKIKKIQNSLTNRHGVLGATKRGVAAVRDAVLDANLSVENAARLAAYKVVKDEAIKNGMSEKAARARAASVSKNLTVNFNRKGEWGPGINSAYLFYSASIQGSARIITALGNPRVRKIVGGVAAAGFALAMYNRSSGDDDDDIPYYDKISDYTKQTNLIIMHPDGSGNYSKVRLPYGYNVFWYAGVEMENLMYNDRATAPKSAMNMLSATLNAYNPIQGADLLDTITPTVLKPMEQDVRNINFMATPLKPENPFDNYDRPESQKAFKSTSPALKEMMALINEKTGGDQTHSGLIDISPEIIKHYTSWITGGAGMTAARTVGTAINLATDEEIDPKNVPLLRTLGGKPGSHFDTGRFYDAIKEVNAVEAQLKLLKGTPEYSEYKSDHSQVHKLSFKMKRYKNKVKRLRDKRDKAYADDDTFTANELREEIRQEMMKFNSLYDEAAEADL